MDALLVKQKSNLEQQLMMLLALFTQTAVALMYALLPPIHFLSIPVTQSGCAWTPVAA
jgi:hypothetical protein